ncbi:uncharacterized protein [Panulirus ornatus]|uniref:uncharacterized protein n=1 Tax=Panulirus ornatus TaxID=150431 RepID=UPI003A844E37
MASQGVEQSPSPSGSEEVESDGDSKHEDDLDNGKESDEENEENVREEADESDSDGSDPTGEEGSENSTKLSDNFKSESDDVKDSESLRKDSEGSLHDPEAYGIDGECYPLADLPLEVITTVEPTNYSYPVLKNMSNGVLTHRNIFTEHERSVLVNIIDKYRNIVDTRSRTREIYLEKQNVWQQIVEEYNSMDNIMVRTEKELRKCWDNMKYRAKQAEKEMIKVLDRGFGGLMVKTEAPDIEVKMEPLDQDDQHSVSDEEDSNDPSSGAAGDDDREPALKRARQESPKLSSLLLAAANKRSPSRKVVGSKNGGVAHKNSSGSFPYNIPACTKVLHVKKKTHPGSANTNATTLTVNAASGSEIPILPKGLASCLSITNIPNPICATSLVGGNVGSHARDSVSPNDSPVQASIKPMPSLKKMVPSKIQTTGISKNTNMRGSRKSNVLSSRVRGHNSAPSHTLISGHNSNSLNNSSIVHCTDSLISPTNTDNDSDRNEIPDRLLNTKLVTQRLELERREHELKMKLLEKELQAQTYQSQYWYLKLKLLRSGRENITLNLAGATNGDID